MFHLYVMPTRKSDEHTLGLNEDTHLEINHKNERTRKLVHSSLVSTNSALLLRGVAIISAVTSCIRRLLI